MDPREQVIKAESNLGLLHRIVLEMSNRRGERSGLVMIIAIAMPVSGVVRVSQEPRDVAALPQSRAWGTRRSSG
jgi:hypothetical protein